MPSDCWSSGRQQGGGHHLPFPSPLVGPSPSPRCLQKLRRLLPRRLLWGLAPWQLRAPPSTAAGHRDDGLRQRQGPGRRALPTACRAPGDKLHIRTPWTSVYKIPPFITARVQLCERRAQGEAVGNCHAARPPASKSPTGLHGQPHKAALSRKTWKLQQAGPTDRQSCSVRTPRRARERPGRWPVASGGDWSQRLHWVVKYQKCTEQLLEKTQPMIN